MGIPQMTVGQQPGMMGQPGMVSQMPVPQQQQMAINQPAMMPIPGSGVSAGPLSLPSSTVAAAQSPLDIFIGPSVVNAAGPQQGAAPQDIQLQQQRTIWSGQYSFASTVFTHGCQLIWSIILNLAYRYKSDESFVGPPCCRDEMYAGRVSCWPLASHGEYANGTDRWTDDRPLRYDFC